MLASNHRAMGADDQRESPTHRSKVPPNSTNDGQQPGLRLQHSVRSMARQQLTISNDSPFSEPEASERGHLEEARLLREETDEIKRQLDSVRNKLNEFNRAKENCRPDNKQQASLGVPGASKHVECDQQRTSSDSQFHRSNQNLSSAAPQSHLESAKLRPLTGKTDCPNCECDRRRQSVCDNCINLRLVVPEPAAEARSRQPTFIVADEQLPSSHQTAPVASSSYRNPDERPIRPAKSSPGEAHVELARGQVVPVDRAMVPNRVFTIGKSLNDKRAQLGKAIEDLQLTMEKVRKRGERLEQERKIAQLYKKQWRSGPAIGGRSLQAARGQGATYQSHLDPQLARDSNSLMGFKHIEPAMRLRQHAPTGPSRAPQPKPRTSRTGSSRVPNVAHQNAVSSRLASGKQASGNPSMHHARSKSLDSLDQVEKIVVTSRPPAALGEARVIQRKQWDEEGSHERRSRSVTALADESREAEEAIEEELEEHVEEAQEEAVGGQEQGDGLAREMGTENDSVKQHNCATDTNQDQSVKKMTWVPVFGETEIKTVERRQPSRKTAVLGARAGGNSGSQRPPGSILRQRACAGLSRETALKHRSHSAVLGGSRFDGSPVMNEASKKLQFANNLLERERRDSRTQNQLLVSYERRSPRVGRSRHQTETQSSFGGRGSESSRRRGAGVDGVAQELIVGANREVDRLEKMIGEQQRILARLSRQASSCCCGQLRADRPLSAFRQTKARTALGLQSPTSSPRLSGAQALAQQPSGRLIAHLRDRLNKTKARLAQTLEEERAKHQELKRKVHSSLRRQSNLKEENELLRQSLGECIDTCLRDISNTFETLSETLVDQEGLFGEAGDGQAGFHESGELAHVAKLIADNRHLKQMRSHIEAIEEQRRCIFEELSNEKLRSKQLELQLIQCRLERDQLTEAKRELECQLHADHSGGGAAASGSLGQRKSLTENGLDASSIPVSGEPQPSTSKQLGGLSESSTSETQQSQADLTDKTTIGSDEQFTTTSATFDSIDIYRKYIQSMTPDLQAARRERRQILDEFDNIKKMLANLND